MECLEARAHFSLMQMLVGSPINKDELRFADLQVFPKQGASSIPIHGQYSAFHNRFSFAVLFVDHAATCIICSAFSVFVQSITMSCSVPAFSSSPSVA